ncbi:hypothetical protein [Roseomonas sp. USHLN139]|uniref:hypothetical protein n=1 Tax=Roseomonas sp. USHLN139 TaxID=3081298 RepID=UPI003B023FDE
MIRRLLLQGLAVAGLTVATACAQPAPPPYPPVPELRREAPLPPPPMPERYVWQPGHWHWNGAAYEWIGGRWILRPVRGAEWVHGHWAWGNAGWAWVPGHWR